MIRFIQCVRRKQDLSTEDFRRHWQGYQAAMQAFAAAAGARRMSVSFGLEIEHNATLQALRGSLEPFDAVLEIWWESGAELVRAAEQPDMQQAIEALRELQAQLVNPLGSSFFFASEEMDLALG
jgi:hypothetical protein